MPETSSTGKYVRVPKKRWSRKNRVLYECQILYSIHRRRLSMQNTKMIKRLVFLSKLKYTPSRKRTNAKPGIILLVHRFMS